MLAIPTTRISVVIVVSRTRTTSPTILSAISELGWSMACASIRVPDVPERLQGAEQLGASITSWCSGMTLQAVVVAVKSKVFLLYYATIVTLWCWHLYCEARWVISDAYRAVPALIATPNCAHVDDKLPLKTFRNAGGIRDKVRRA